MKTPVFRKSPRTPRLRSHAGWLRLPPFANTADLLVYVHLSHALCRIDVEFPMLYQWILLQNGSLPLKPDQQFTSEPHVCSATLVWPVDTAPAETNSLVVDPCFSTSGLTFAVRQLSALGASLEDIGFFFETHGHGDHVLNIRPRSSAASSHWSTRQWRRWTVSAQQDLDATRGIQPISCPGHADDLQALRFATREGETWIVGDAILDLQWLRLWQYYWPNMYGRDDVLQTWRTVAEILAHANVVIPGHGPPFAVDAALLEELVGGFTHAEHHEHCADVVDRLRHRLAALRR